MVDIVKKVASTIFQTGPKDNLKAVDFYKQNPAALPDKPVSVAATALATKAAELAKKAVTSPAVIKSLAKGAATGEGFDPTALLTQLKRSSGGLNSPIAQLSTSIQNEIFKAMGFTPDPKAGSKGLAGGVSIAGHSLDFSDARFIVGLTTRIIEGKAFDSATDTVALLSAITGNADIAKVLDMTGTFAIANTLLKQASELHIPELIDIVLAQFSDAKDQKRLLLSHLRVAAVNSDLDSIEKAITYVGAAGVLSRVPDIVPLILQYYRIPDKTPPTGYPALQTRLLNLVNTISPTWYQYDRNGTLITDLSVLQRASSDAIRILESTDGGPIDLFVASLLAKSIPAGEIIGVGKKFYPLARLTPPPPVRQAIKKAA